VISCMVSEMKERGKVGEERQVHASEAIPKSGDGTIGE
jgi:hypothetical protein